MDEHGGQQPVVRSTAFAALKQDHHALAEAVHGLLGRVGLLEARVDYLEHGRADARKLMERTGYTPPPTAIDIGLSHVGRKLFLVDGETGVWCGRKDFGETTPKTIWVAIPEKRGRSGRKRLYRQDALSARMVTVLEKCGAAASTNTKGISDGD
jgi:hypothetical protein